MPRFPMSRPRTSRSSPLVTACSVIAACSLIAACAAIAAPSIARADEEPPVEIVLVSNGDDDLDGVPDLDDDVIPHASSGLELKLPAKRPSPLVDDLDDPSFALFAGERRLSKGPVGVLRGGLRLQARAPGRRDVRVFGVRHRIGAIALSAIDGRGHVVDLARSHASIERTPPTAFEGDPAAPDGDPDALRFVVTGHPDDLPTTLSFASTETLADSRRGVEPVSMVALDLLRRVPLVTTPCPAGTATTLACATTQPIRTVMDDLDRNHPLSAARSVKVELGGLLAVALGDRPAEIFLRVGGPRDTAVGTIDRLRAKLRVRLVRLGRGGPPPIGESDADALERMRDEVDRGNMIWGACGVSFGPRGASEVSIVDPPPSLLLSIGCDVGAPASGGTIRFEADGRTIEVHTQEGDSPRGVARVVARALERAGLRATVSDSAAIGAATYGTSDVVVRRPNGDPVALKPPSKPLATRSDAPGGAVSDDATLGVCIGHVDLDDGLAHFTDANAIAGTLEERTLIKAFDDGDPSTIELFVVPSFGGDSRIGESFIFADGGAIKDVVIQDRASLRADRASFTLAHELGHVLLDQPGHPDDFGLDTPTRLMDADAVNASAFGPRRLTLAECERVVRQSGPDSLPRLLTPWPTTRSAPSTPRR